MTDTSPEDGEVVAAFARWAVAVESGDQAAARRLAEDALALARSSSSRFVSVAEILVEDAGGAIASAPCETPSYSCSFCGAPDGGGTRLVAGPEVFICRSCVDSRVVQLASYDRTANRTDASGAVSTTAQDRPCSFCNRPRGDGAAMFSADVHSMCEGCVRICVDMFASEGDG
jgi:hypothetical protein